MRRIVANIVVEIAKHRCYAHMSEDPREYQKLDIFREQRVKRLLLIIIIIVICINLIQRVIIITNVL